MRYNLGWIPDFPDFRDYTFKNIKDQLKVKSNSGIGLPSQLSLRDKCSPVVDQGNLGSCTANAGVGLVEYYERSRLGNYTSAARLFLYKTTRNLSQSIGDSGASVRSTIGALVLFGVPPEDYWPYTDDINQFDQEPPAFCYALAQNYRTLLYFRHDPPGIPLKDLLTSIKTSIYSKNPVIFGFSVYSSIDQAEKNSGLIPFPSAGENFEDGHTMVIVGYDDNKVIVNALDKKATTGAFEIRNSWGVNWGDNGYGWLPYEYVLQGLAQDFWSILKENYVETDQFLKEKFPG